MMSENISCDTFAVGSSSRATADHQWDSDRDGSLEAMVVHFFSAAERNTRTCWTWQR